MIKEHAMLLNLLACRVDGQDGGRDSKCSVELEECVQYHTRSHEPVDVKYNWIDFT